MKTRELISWIVVLLLTLMLVLRNNTTQTVEIPAKTGEFINNNPTPILTEVVEDKITKEPKTLNTYKEVYKDEVQEIEVESKVVGEMISQKINYKILPQTIQVKVKQPSTHLYLGLEAQISPEVELSPTLYITTPKVLYKASYNIQNKGFSVGAAIKLF